MVGTVLIAACSGEPQTPDFERPALIIQDARLQYPADIVKFKGRYVVTELYKNRLAAFSDLQLGDVEYFDPGKIGQEFNAPHFLAVTAADTLLISNGWGDSVVEIADLAGRGWREFKGVGKKFNGPHGLCVDESGWIYVGDSLNSRLVRFRDMQGTGWEVFSDVDRRISYIRQLACRDGIVWVSNSYENLPGLNSGLGGNILAIRDFGSGKADTVFTFEKSNLTGVLPINDRDLLIGLWGIRRQLVLFDMERRSAKIFNRQKNIGTPYGMFLDQARSQVLVMHIGDLPQDGTKKKNIGGIAVYRK